jgi:hypothetical protein
MNGRRVWESRMATSLRKCKRIVVIAPLDGALSIQARSSQHVLPCPFFDRHKTKYNVRYEYEDANHLKIHTNYFTVNGLTSI